MIERRAVVDVIKGLDWRYTAPIQYAAFVKGRWGMKWVSRLYASATGIWEVRDD